ncbi:UDP-N-acetylglucosamine 1-carboxyvinyltransferase [Pseudomonadota bacterium]
MAKFSITGGKPLYGSVRLGGAKNASYKIMIASLLAGGESRLLNFSHIHDVTITRHIIESLGGNTRQAGERNIFINPQKLISSTVADEYGPQSRASTMFLPILLHRFGQASVPAPGGDDIGTRPLGRHFDGLKSMGVTIKADGNRIHAHAKKLKGVTYKFAKNTHTGTETLILAAVRATGVTTLENAALEPEIDDLISFLNNMGANIRRRPGKIIQIQGVSKLKPAIHSIMPDRNEAVSYACAAIATKGDVIVENADPHQLEAFLEKLEDIGAQYEIGSYGIRFFTKNSLKATDITTKPHPGFMTDWQPLWTVLATQLQGESIIHETIFPNRFQHVDGLNQRGANINHHQVSVDNPSKTYNFNIANDSASKPHAIKVQGPTPLKATKTQVYDLRSGATMVLAALIAPGQSILEKVELIDRGYESFDQRLRSLGADIKRLD